MNPFLSPPDWTGLLSLLTSQRSQLSQLLHSSTALDRADHHLLIPLPYPRPSSARARSSHDSPSGIWWAASNPTQLTLTLLVITRIEMEARYEANGFLNAGDRRAATKY